VAVDQVEAAVAAYSAIIEGYLGARAARPAQAGAGR